MSSSLTQFKILLLDLNIQIALRVLLIDLDRSHDTRTTCSELAWKAVQSGKMRIVTSRELVYRRSLCDGTEYSTDLRRHEHGSRTLSC